MSYEALKIALKNKNIDEFSRLFRQIDFNINRIENTEETIDIDRSTETQTGNIIIKCGLIHHVIDTGNLIILNKILSAKGIDINLEYVYDKQVIYSTKNFHPCDWSRIKEKSFYSLTPVEYAFKKKHSQLALLLITRGGKFSAEKISNDDLRYLFNQLADDGITEFRAYFELDNYSNQKSKNFFNQLSDLYFTPQVRFNLAMVFANILQSSTTPKFLSAATSMLFFDKKPQDNTKIKDIQTFNTGLNSLNC